MSYSVAVVNINFALRFKNFDCKNFIPNNQEKAYTYFPFKFRKSTWKQKLRKSSGKINIQNSCEPWSCRHWFYRKGNSILWQEKSYRRYLCWWTKNNMLRSSSKRKYHDKVSCKLSSLTANPKCCWWLFNDKIVLFHYWKYKNITSRKRVKLLTLAKLTPEEDITPNQGSFFRRES